MSKGPINFKDSKYALHWLETALNMEKEKYATCPVKNDLMPGHVNAQAWGYVVAGYFLLEQSFKLLLHVRSVSPDKTHTLSADLFGNLPEDDKKVLREYYRDFRSAFENAKTFPFSELDDFLINLDGGTDGKGKHVGSFDWRYFPIEEAQGGTMPTVSIEFLHEIIYAAVCIIEYGVFGNFAPSRYTYSWRRYDERYRKYRDWLRVRMNSEGWNGLGDRLELAWGPDYRNRYDYFIFKGSRIIPFFAEIPLNHGLPVEDRRDEVEAFDVDKGFASIGIRRSPRRD